MGGVILMSSDSTAWRQTSRDEEESLSLEKKISPFGRNDTTAARFYFNRLSDHFSATTRSSIVSSVALATVVVGVFLK